MCTLAPRDRIRYWSLVSWLTLLARTRVALGHRLLQAPEVEWDQAKMKGRPFFYSAYGAAVAEVAIDTLTESAEYSAPISSRTAEVIEPDHRSRPDRGRLCSREWAGLPAKSCGGTRKGGYAPQVHQPTRFQAAATSRPCLTARILDDSPARVDTIFRSKAWENRRSSSRLRSAPPSRNAIASVSDGAGPVSLDLPATPERILMAIERARTP